MEGGDEGRGEWRVEMREGGRRVEMREGVNGGWRDVGREGGHYERTPSDILCFACPHRTAN